MRTGLSKVLDVLSSEARMLTLGVVSLHSLLTTAQLPLVVLQNLSLRAFPHSLLPGQLLGIYS